MTRVWIAIQENFWLVYSFWCICTQPIHRIQSEDISSPFKRTFPAMYKASASPTRECKWLKSSAVSHIGSVMNLVSMKWTLSRSLGEFAFLQDDNKMIVRIRVREPQTNKILREKCAYMPSTISFTKRLYPSITVGDLQSFGLFSTPQSLIKSPSGFRWIVRKYMLIFGSISKILGFWTIADNPL